MKTAQEIFTEVSRHLIRQSAKAEDQVERYKDEGPIKMCAYRTRDGLKCAAGVLIYDEHYDKTFEGMTVGNPDIQKALFKSGIDMDDHRIGGLVAELQSIHDHSPVALWGLTLREVAERRGLTFPS